MLNKETKYRLRDILSVLLVELTFWAVVLLLTVIWTYNIEEDLQWRHPWVLFFEILCCFPLIFFISRKWKTEGGKESYHPRIFVGRTNSTLLRPAMLRFAFGFLVIALAQPIIGVQNKNAIAKNTEVIFTIDISNSMNTQDISEETSRLEIAKRAANGLVNELSGERVGMVIFAGNAYSYLPITKDYAAVKLFLQDLESKMISAQGTNLDDALKESFQLFTDDNAKKMVLLMTDGENHQDMPGEILEEYVNNGVYLMTMGIGTKKGGLVPNVPGEKSRGYKRDAEGKVVLSKMNKKLISEIAKKARGTAYYVDSPFPNLSDILTEINQLNKGKFRDLKIEIAKNFYRLPLVLGCLFWLLYMLDLQLFKRKLI